MKIPYATNNKEQMIDYAKVTKQLFDLGMKEAAYGMFLKDPNGNDVSFEFFCSVMESRK